MTEQLRFAATFVLMIRGEQPGPRYAAAAVTVSSAPTYAWHKTSYACFLGSGSGDNVVVPLFFFFFLFFLPSAFLLRGRREEEKKLDAVVCVKTYCSFWGEGKV